MRRVEDATPHPQSLSRLVALQGEEEQWQV